jgi:hypothetical protein
VKQRLRRKAEKDGSRSTPSGVGPLVGTVVKIESFEVIVVGTGTGAEMGVTVSSWPSCTVQT